MRSHPLVRRRCSILALGLSIAVAVSAGRAGAAEDPKDRFVREKLEEPIAMKFADAPLEDVLKYIKSASEGPTDTGIPIYVDPEGLAAAGASITSKVSIDATGVPLKTSLRKLLKPLGLTYRVDAGLLKIEADPEKGKPKQQ